jgi:hypothetical protein
MPKKKIKKEELPEFVYVVRAEDEDESWLIACNTGEEVLDNIAVGDCSASAGVYKFVRNVVFKRETIITEEDK